MLPTGVDSANNGVRVSGETVQEAEAKCPCDTYFNFGAIHMLPQKWEPITKLGLCPFPGPSHWTWCIWVNGNVHRKSATVRVNAL